MQINRKLNLVIPLPRGDNLNIYVHSTPIGRVVFEAYFMVIAKTFASIYGEGLGVSSGPAVSALLLLQEAKKMGGDDYVAEVKAGLIAEIHRLTSVMLLTDNGWETIPFDEAIRKNMLDQDEASEVENALAFFTVISAMHKKAQLPGVLGMACDLWQAQIVSSNSTDFAASLRIPTKGDDTTVKATA